MSTAREPTADLALALKAIEKACWIIEQADAENLFTDGPLTGLAPQMNLRSWQALYTVLDKARKQ